jgi:hypothetical protein
MSGSATEDQSPANVNGAALMFYSADDDSSDDDNSDYKQEQSRYYSNKLFPLSKTKVA